MSLHEVLLNELKDLYSAENQLLKALPKTAKAAKTAELKQGFLTHLEQTRGQIERLKQIFEILGKKPSGKHCDGMKGAIDELKEALDKDSDGAVYDSGIIGAAMRVAHYEIAGYSAAVLIATALGETEVAGLLKETLVEEQTMSKQLVTVGKAIFKQALAEGGDNKGKPQKTPRDARHKRSEKESKDDEKRTAKGPKQNTKSEKDELMAKAESEDGGNQSKKSAAGKAAAKKRTPEKAKN